MGRDFHFSIDRGGTFTDVFAQVAVAATAATKAARRRALARGACFTPEHSLPDCRCQMAREAAPSGVAAATAASQHACCASAGWHSCQQRSARAGVTVHALHAATRVLKLLSEDPANYPDAPREGIRRVLEDVTGVLHPRCGPRAAGPRATRLSSSHASQQWPQQPAAASALVRSSSDTSMHHTGSRQACLCTCLHWGLLWC